MGVYTNPQTFRKHVYELTFMSLTFVGLRKVRGGTEFKGETMNRTVKRVLFLRVARSSTCLQLHRSLSLSDMKNR